LWRKVIESVSDAIPERIVFREKHPLQIDKFWPDVVTKIFKRLIIHESLKGLPNAPAIPDQTAGAAPPKYGRPATAPSDLEDV
jgi:hypothetical protein